MKTDTILTLKDVSKITKYSINYLYKVYHTWRDKGVRIIKIAPNAAPRFYLSDILKMLEQQK